MIFFSLIFNVFEVQKGSKYNKISLNKGDVLNITSKVFPYYIVLIKNDDYSTNKAVFTSYFSYTRKNYVITKHSFIRFLPRYLKFSVPFVYSTIEAREDVTLDFVTVALPGMCNSGILFTAQSKSQIIFILNETSDFFELDDLDDKCIVFANNNNDFNISVNMESSDYEDQIFFYNSLNDFVSMTGSLSSYNYSNSKNDNNVFFIRIVRNSDNPPKNISLIYRSKEDDGEEWYDYYIPSFITSDCHKKTWYSNSYVIIMIILQTILLLVLVGFFTDCLVTHESRSMPYYVSLSDLSIDGASSSSKTPDERYSSFKIKRIYDITSILQNK